MAFDFRELNRIEEAAFNSALMNWLNKSTTWTLRNDPPIGSNEDLALKARNANPSPSN